MSEKKGYSKDQHDTSQSHLHTGCGAVRLHDLEEVVYQQMVKKLEDNKALTGRKEKRAASPKLTARQTD